MSTVTDWLDMVVDERGYRIDAESIVRQSKLGTEMLFVCEFSALTMFYQGRGNVLIEIHSDFTKTEAGALLIEVSSTAGRSWTHRDCEKVGRGMTTSLTDRGPALFRTQIDARVTPEAIRIRCQDTKEMEPIAVSISFAGIIHHHQVRTPPDFIVQEEP